MAEKQNTALRNRLADSFAGGFNSGTLKIYSGTQPANAGDAPGGTDVLLCTIALPNPAFAAAANGSAAKTGTWSATNAASGLAGWFRFTSSDGTLIFDGAVAPWTQVNITGGITATDTTITVNSTAAFPSSGTIKIDNEEINYTAKTATTFTGCTRGANSTAAATHANSANVLSMSTAYEMRPDNPNLLVNQVLTISAFTYTAPAA